MTFNLSEAFGRLERTPRTLDALVRDTPLAWHTRNEGPETWSAWDVVGHLIHGEETDWVPRARILLEHGRDQPFEPFDRFAQFERFAGVPLGALLDRFAARRAANLEIVRGWNLSESDLDREGLHPELGTVTLRQLLATWVVHDLGHIAQIARVLAKGYREEVGAWRAYLSILETPRR